MKSIKHFGQDTLSFANPINFFKCFTNPKYAYYNTRTVKWKKTKPLIKIVAFDLDGTLTDGYSWTLFHTIGGVTPKEQHEWLIQYARNQLTYHEWITRIETKYRQSGKTQTEFSSATRIIPLKKDAQKVISTLKRHIPVLIVSSSIDIYVEVVAQKLGITAFHANHTLLFNKQGTFEKIAYQSPEAEAKVLYLETLCRQYGLTPQEICFVGDSLGDLSAFQFTGRGILVGNGSPDLVEAAWKQVETLSDVLMLIV